MNLRPVLLLSPSYERPSSILLDCPICGVLVVGDLSLRLGALVANHEHADVRARQFAAVRGSTAERRGTGP